MAKILFHPNITMVEASRIAHQQGYTLKYCGNRFVMRRHVVRPFRNKDRH